MDKVVHFEIPADNLGRAKKFYEAVFGWEINAVPEMNYTMVRTTPVDENSMPTEPGSINGGMMKRMAKVKSPVVTIMVQSIEEATRVHLSGGGTGFNLSCIPAENGRFVKRTKDVLGPIAIMSTLSASTIAVKQGGIRQGCNIAMLNVHHPDILAFIHAKNNPAALPNFYLAVGLPEDFIQALKNGTDYDLFDPITGETTERQNAAEVFKQIVDQTWKTGDPKAN